MPNLTDMNVRGVVFMVLAMAAFALADALVKLSAAFLTPAQVVGSIPRRALEVRDGTGQHDLTLLERERRPQ